jgi:hypothetical protein
MDVKRIVIIVFVLLVILYLVINAFSKTTQLSTMASGKVSQRITYDKLKNNNNSSNFTYSMWLFVDDWNYKFGQEKEVLDRRNSPTIVLGDKPNTLKIYMDYYSQARSTASTPVGASASSTMNAATQAACAACAAGYTCACDQCNNGVSSEESTTTEDDADEYGQKRAINKVNTCLIENIPIQKWFNIIVSLYGRTMDVYLDGKLVRTCVMPGVPHVNNRAPIIVTGNDGFSGWTTKFNFWSDATNPQEAYNIYKSGYGGSILGNALSKYRVQVSVLKDNKQKGAFQI